MRKLTMAEVQKKAVDILVYIDKICRENNLKYTIFYGSLIGVERHRGFIPWDDDIDIVMPRPDYEELMELLKHDSNYKLLSFETRENFRYPFAKVVDPQTVAKTKQFFSGEEEDLGVFVDVFPIDGIPDSKEERQVLREETETYRLNLMDTLGLSYARSFNVAKAMIKLVVRYPHHKKLMKIGNNVYWQNKYQEAAKKIALDETQTCGYLEWIHIHWGVFPTQWFESYEDVEFEGHKVMAIKNRRDFLTLRYGDYMTMPPENERITHHPYDFYEK
ncbi:lipopolysaccharide cholinephosphotransferase [Enterococcus villorum]|uniref:Lipopolysaccharide cholinephosphotransferase n=1 Tax=Enterococcus villorum TaxID=112904 RepID=A0A1V8YE98_9ENTE|nr:LicD family protein [Enterococcus villorum]OQO70923.1 lipopolysaccharide cholinephosphotransferase [Enterococcus villorum]OQO74889.1 lipopolysaccharide cholinephosphotransferase [Enterococcus villorum]